MSRWCQKNGADRLAHPSASGSASAQTLRGRNAGSVRRVMSAEQEACLRVGPVPGPFLERSGPVHVGAHVSPSPGGTIAHHVVGPHWIHSTVGGHLDHWHILALINSTAFLCKHIFHFSSLST